jgi:hypothetical protein
MCVKREGLMLQSYIEFVNAHPLLSSILQVGILGMSGELAVARMKHGYWTFRDLGAKKLVLKSGVWSCLGLITIYAFTGYPAYIDAVIDKGIWLKSAQTNVLIRALSISLFLNLLFGPLPMLFHRWTNSWIDSKPMDWESLQKAWMTILWFWIPAQTITFCLPKDFQVGLAAVWSIALGIILGYFGSD